MILDFGSFTRRGLLADLEHTVEIWVVTYLRQSRWGKATEEMVEDRKTIDLPLVRESESPKDSASSREIPTILKALVSTA